MTLRHHNLLVFEASRNWYFHRTSVKPAIYRRENHVDVDMKRPARAWKPLIDAGATACGSVLGFWCGSTCTSSKDCAWVNATNDEPPRH
jgi:hypothetical protein